MQLTINGQTKTMTDVATVRDLLEQLGRTTGAVAVEVNRQLVPKREHAQTALHENDTVEIVTLVGGG